MALFKIFIASTLLGNGLSLLPKVVRRAVPLATEPQRPQPKTLAQAQRSPWRLPAGCCQRTSTSTEFCTAFSIACWSQSLNSDASQVSSVPSGWWPTPVGTSKIFRRRSKTDFRTTRRIRKFCGSTRCDGSHTGNSIGRAGRRHAAPKNSAMVNGTDPASAGANDRVGLPHDSEGGPIGPMRDFPA